MVVCEAVTMFLVRLLCMVKLKIFFFFVAYSIGILIRLNIYFSKYDVLVKIELCYTCYFLSMIDNQTLLNINGHNIHILISTNIMQYLNQTLSYI